MSSNNSTAVGKGCINQDDVVLIGFSAESNATSHSKMSKYQRFDNPNTDSHSAGMHPSDVPDNDVQEFDRVFTGDRSGMIPGGGLYLPEDRGTIGPNISDIYGQNTGDLNLSTDQQGHNNPSAIDAASDVPSEQMTGIGFGVHAMMQKITRTTNGLEIVDQLRSQADTLDGERTVTVDDGFGGSVYIVHDEGELIEKASLNEAANQLEQYLQELGSEGMCSDSELQKFWQEARYLNGADIVNQMRQDAKSKEIAAELEKYINNLGTDGMCSNKDLQTFWEETRYLNGADIIDQFRSRADALDGERTVIADDGWGGAVFQVHDESELREKAALNEAVPIFEQYLDNLETDGKCSIKDVEQFFNNYLSDYENPFQASELTRNYLEAAASPNSSTTTDSSDSSSTFLGLSSDTWGDCGRAIAVGVSAYAACQTASKFACWGGTLSATLFGANCVSEAYNDWSDLFQNPQPPQNATSYPIDPVTGEVIDEGDGDGGYGGGSDMSGLGGNPDTDSIGGEGMSR